MELKPFTGELDPPKTAPAAAPTSSGLMPFTGKLDEAPVAAAAPPSAPERSAVQEVGRQLGLTARHAVNGVAAIPAMAANAVAGVANKGLDLAMGEGKGFRFPDQAKALDNALTSAGLPQPENAVERVVGDATSALAGTGGVVKAGQALAQRAASPVAQGVGKALAADPTLEPRGLREKQAAAKVHRWRLGSWGRSLQSV